MAAAALAALALATQASARESCTAGPRTAGGITYRTFCGKARATVHFGGRTYRFVGGSCDSTPSVFTISIGTATLPPGKPKYRYFGGTVVTARDGMFTNQAVTWQLPRRAPTALFHAKIRLQGGRKHGTFTGTTLTDRRRGFGTFSC